MVGAQTNILGHHSMGIRGHTHILHFNFFCLLQAIYLSLSQCSHSSTLYFKVFSLVIGPTLKQADNAYRVLISALNHFCPTSCRDPTLPAAEKQQYQLQRCSITSPRDAANQHQKCTFTSCRDAPSPAAESQHHRLQRCNITGCRDATSPAAEMRNHQLQRCDIISCRDVTSPAAEM